MRTRIFASRCQSLVVTVAKVVSLVWLLSCLLSAQPQIYEGGIVNAASYGMGERERNHVAPGSIAAIFGKRLADVTLRAQSVPLPFELGGVRVTVGGLPAPIFFVSPGQINIQIPRDVIRLWHPVNAPSEPVSVVVTNPAGASSPVIVWIAGQAPGIFTLDGSGCGPPAVLNVAQDGTVSQNSPSNPAPPGSYVTVFGTGLGRLGPEENSSPRDGEVPLEVRNLAGGPIFQTYIAFLALVRPQVGTGAAPDFAGRAPGQVGVDQWNFRIPEEVANGCNQSFVITQPLIWRHQSQYVSISVGPRGQICKDPILESGAEVTWKRVVVHTRDGKTQREEFVEVRIARNRNPGPFRRTIQYYRQFLESFGFSFSSLGAPTETAIWPQCPDFADIGLDAGTITVDGPMGRYEVPRSSSDGAGANYRLTFLPGTIRAGSYSVRGSGGKDVGPFETTINLSDPVELTTPMDEGKPICPRDVRLRVTAPASSEDLIRATLIGGGRTYDLAGPAKAQDLRFEWRQDGPVLLPPLPDPQWLRVFQEPWEKNVHEFTASGLTAGGRHGWKYEWRWESVETGCPAQ